MKWTKLGSAAVMLLFCTIGIGAQESQSVSRPMPALVLGPPLVAWSELQSPRPIQQTTPACESESPCPSRGDLLPVAEVQTEPPTQVFVGTIVREGRQYILKVLAGPSYEIDDQDQSRRNEGKQVRITGWIDTKSRILHVKNFELLGGQER